MVKLFPKLILSYVINEIKDIICLGRLLELLHRVQYIFDRLLQEHVVVSLPSCIELLVKI
jgi:hypothetical protein